MNNLLYFVAVVLVIGWALGFFYFHASFPIHLLLVVAIVAILMKVMQSQKEV